MKPKKAQLGRPPLPEEQRRVRVNVMLAPDVVDALSRVANRSQYIEALIRADKRLKA